MHILRCMGSKFCVKFQRAPLKFRTKFWTHTPQNMHFTVFSFCVWVTISLNCDVISLSETGPRYLILSAMRFRWSTARSLHNDLQRGTGVQIADQTVRNRLYSRDLRSQRPFVDLILTPCHRAAWRAFAREHQNWQVRHWRPVLFTNGSRFNLSGSDGP